MVGYIALFAFAIGGVAQALPGKNTVDSGDIRKGQVKKGDLAANSVDGTKVVDDSLTGADVNEASLNIPQQAIPTTLPPSGAAGGDLSGTYPNPQVQESGLVPGGDLAGTLANAEVVEASLVPGGDLSGTVANAQVIETGLVPGGDLSGTLANAQVSEAGLATGGDVSGPVSNVQIGPGVVGDAEAGNVTRSILIPAAELNPPLVPASFTAPDVVAVLGIAATLSFDDSQVNAVLATTRVPLDREAGTDVDLVLHWSAVNGSGGTGSVRFNGDFVSAAEGEASFGASTNLDFGIANAPLTANTLETSTETIDESLIANGDLFHFSVRRDGSLGTDDQVGDARLHLIEFRYTAVR